MELAEVAGFTEVFFAFGKARGLSVLEEFDGELEGSEKTLLDESAVEEGFGFEVAGFECFAGGGAFVAAETVEAPLDFGESADEVGCGFANW
jgi:hypothetical protein